MIARAINLLQVIDTENNKSAMHWFHKVCMSYAGTRGETKTRTGPGEFFFGDLAFIIHL